MSAPFLACERRANQDVVATIKRQLQLLLPGVRIFLDVDDLQRTDDLEIHVAESQAMLIVLANASQSGYFASKNCLREVAAAQVTNMRLILVHDGDVSKGGAPLEEIRHACRSGPKPADCHRAPSDFFSFIFEGREVIPWHRLTVFQLETLKRIAE